MTNSQEEIKYFVPTAENKHYVADYPHGWNKRCEMWYWLEFTKYGVRTVRQSKFNGRFAKPKKSTYYQCAIAYLNEDEHLKYNVLHSMDMHSEGEKESVKVFFDRMSTIENLPLEMQKELDKYNGTATEENHNYKFTKINSHTYQVPTIKLTFDSFDSVKFKAIYQALKDHEEREKLFSLNGGYIIAYRSTNQYFIDETVYNTYSARFEAENDPFSFKEEMPEDAKNYTSIPKKKEQPTEERKLSIEEMTETIETNLKNILPEGAYIEVKNYKGYYGESISIRFAAGEKAEREYSQPQLISLDIEFNKLLLGWNSNGGRGGRSITLTPDPGTHYAYKSIHLPFRTPAKTETKVLAYINKFALNWINALKENIDRLPLRETVDYKEFLK